MLNYKDKTVTDINTFSPELAPLCPLHLYKIQLIHIYRTSIFIMGKKITILFSLSSIIVVTSGQRDSMTKTVNLNKLVM